jgi:hypothetical protein
LQKPSANATVVVKGVTKKCRKKEKVNKVLLLIIIHKYRTGTAFTAIYNCPTITILHPPNKALNTLHVHYLQVALS